MAFGYSNHHKKTPVMTKSKTLKQHFKRWIGWGSKKTQQQKQPPALFNESLPLSSCVDEGIYDDATSSCPLIPKKSSASIISSTLSTIYSPDMSIMDEPPSATLDTSSSSDTIATAPPPSLTQTKHLSRSSSWNEPIDQPQDMDHDVDIKADVQKTEDSKYLVYEWPSDDDEEEDNNDNDNSDDEDLTVCLNQEIQAPIRPALSMTRSASHYFDCTLPLDQIENLEPIDQDLSSGSNSSFYSTNSSFTVAYDDSASILDRDALILVTHGVEFLKRCENTNWDETNQSYTMSPSCSGITLVPLKGQGILSLDKRTNRVQDDEQELHRLVNTHILF